MPGVRLITLVTAGSVARKRHLSKIFGWGDSPNRFYGCASSVISQYFKRNPFYILAFYRMYSRRCEQLPLSSGNIIRQSPCLINEPTKHIRSVLPGHLGMPAYRWMLDYFGKLFCRSAHVTGHSSSFWQKLLAVALSIILFPTVGLANCDLKNYRWDCDMLANVNGKGNTKSLIYCDNINIYVTPAEYDQIARYQRNRVDMELMINGSFFSGPCIAIQR